MCICIHLHPKQCSGYTLGYTLGKKKEPARKQTPMSGKVGAFAPNLYLTQLTVSTSRLLLRPG